MFSGDGQGEPFPGVKAPQICPSGHLFRGFKADPHPLLRVDVETLMERHLSIPLEGVASKLRPSLPWRRGDQPQRRGMQGVTQRLPGRTIC